MINKGLFRLALGVLALGLVLPVHAKKATLTGDYRLIGEVAVEGNHFIKAKTVLAKVKARKGGVVVDPTFRADVDRLLETGQYDDVRVSMEDIPGTTDAKGQPEVRIVYTIAERPVVRRVDYKGNVKLSSGKFSDQVGSKAGESYDRFKAAQDAQKIVDKYHEEGYADAKVEFYTSLNPKKNKTILTFFITEGSRVLIKVVNVEGNRAFSVKRVRKTLAKTRRKKVFKEDTLREDLETLKKYYMNRGYLEVSIPDPARAFNEDHTAVTLNLAITEGPRYTVGAYTFEGNTVYTDKQLNNSIFFKRGKLYNQEKVDESVRGLQDLYADKGYLRAIVDPVNETHPVSESRGNVDIRFTIEESSVVYVDRIYVDGNTYTKEKVVRREVLLKEGDIFSSGKVRRSVEKLYNLGFLDDVQIDVQQPRSATKADLVFTVTEGKPGVLSAGAGYSSIDKVIGTAEVQHTNLFGLGQRVNASSEFGAHRTSYDLGWTDPWIFNKRVSFGVDLFDTDRDMPYRNTDLNYDNRYAYSRRNRGFGLRAGPRLTEQLSLVHNYSYEMVRKHDIDNNGILLANGTTTYLTDTIDFLEKKNITSSLTNGVVYDTRDNVFDATKGYRTSAMVQWAGGALGGTNNYYKPEVMGALYVPTFWKFVITLSGRMSYIRPYGRTKLIPVEEYLYVGGMDTVRGYKYGAVGESSARTMAVFNAEYKFPIVQEKHRTILQGAFFADAGGAWARQLSRIDLKMGRHPGQMRASAGFGIRFKTPVFPIRLDYAIPLHKLNGEEVEFFNFTIGNMF